MRVVYCHIPQKGQRLSSRQVGALAAARRFCDETGSYLIALTLSDDSGPSAETAQFETEWGIEVDEHAEVRAGNSALSDARCIAEAVRAKVFELRDIDVMVFGLDCGIPEVVEELAVLLGWETLYADQVFWYYDGFVFEDPGAAESQGRGLPVLVCLERPDASGRKASEAA